MFFALIIQIYVVSLGCILNQLSPFFTQPLTVFMGHSEFFWFVLYTNRFGVGLRKISIQASPLSAKSLSIFLRHYILLGFVIRTALFAACILGGLIQTSLFSAHQLTIFVRRYVFSQSNLISRAFHSQSSPLSSFVSFCDILRGTRLFDFTFRKASLRRVFDFSFQFSDGFVKMLYFFVARRKQLLHALQFSSIFLTRGTGLLPKKHYASSILTAVPEATKSTILPAPLSST